MGLEIPSLMAQTSQGTYAPLKDLFLFFRNKANYVKNLEDNLMTLTAEVTTFYSRKKQITETLEKSVTKEETDEYKILLKQIDVFSKRCVKFISKYGRVSKNLPSPTQELDASVASTMINVLQQVKPTIFKRKFFTLAKLSKDVEKLHVHVSQINGKMIPENLMIDKEAELVQKKPDDDIDLPSMTKYVDKVLSYLCGDDKSVGIMGVIGVGKTTLMRKLNNRLQDISTSFSTHGTMMNLNSVFVIWINYPKELNEKEKIVERMQDAIMRRFKLNREEGNSLEQNAVIISTFLCQKKYIVLFDQVSSIINLCELGICLEDHKFGKIVVASSSKKVINVMTNQKVTIQPLSMEDALILFQKVCAMKFDRRIEDIARLIIDSCGSLPLVIKLVATHLKGVENEDEWGDVKRMLQAETRPALLNLGGVGNAYKLVYDGLKETYLKKCLLFGALFPCHHKIYTDYLVECWTAENFLPLSDADVPKLRRARERGATTLRVLTDKYLFEQCSYKYVKMPVYFRKVALEEKYPDEENCVVLVPEANRSLLNPENWKRATRMSFVCGESELPENPESNNISTLLLQWNPELVKLGELFFCNMQNLQILDLNKTGIESLPSSFSSLVNLISLYLNDCSRLAKLPAEIRLLEKLEFLDIRGTAIPFLPCEIGYMISLRCLRITFSQKGCHRNRNGKEVELMSPLNIISRLQLLEELTIETGCCCQSWNNIADQLANELISLEKLTTLSFHFPSVCSLENFVSNSKSWKNKEMGSNTFRSFKFSIGCCDTQHPYGSSICGLLAERHLTFSSNEEVSSVKEALKQASAFELIGHSSVKTLSDFGLENIEALKICVVERCKNLASMVDADGITQNTNVCILQFLEKLHLFNLQLLECVWKGSTFPGNSFSRMKVLTLHGCPKLTHILDHKLAKAFSSLKHLKVEKCSNLIEIVKVPDEHNISEHVDASDILHKLKTIELVNLPELQDICKNPAVNLNSLREIVMKKCNKLRGFSVGNAGKLKAIRCEASWWSGVLQWPDEQKQRFCHLCDFIAMESQSSNVNGESSGSSL